MSNPEYVRVANVADVQTAGCMAVQANGHTLALFAANDQIYAVDNRCPHMGFPLDRGTVRNGILTCHWHHARFDLQSGGTFDQWADDVRAFPVEVRDDEVWVDVAASANRRAQQRERLLVGLEQDLPLVIGKSVMILMEGNGSPVEPFQIGLEFGARYRRNGWGQGLTILTCLMNILPYLDDDDRSRALYHGLAAVARDTFGSPPRFPIRPLPTENGDIRQLKQWFRQFIEVRDSEGAERCIVSAIRAGASPAQMADMLFSAATDHRYIQIGHVADFTNKAFEALDKVGWVDAELVLTSLVTAYANADRMEEANAWRYPIDLVAILERAFERFPAGVTHESTTQAPIKELVALLLADDPQAIADGLLNCLSQGYSPVDLAATVTYAAALRIARFHTSNEFGDWDTALHTFTFANAIEQGLRRTSSLELLRGVFDAAMSVYLDRFLNIPPARLPEPNGHLTEPAQALLALPTLLNQQQQVNPAGDAVAQFLYHEGQPGLLLAMLGKLLLREDRDFHTIQTIEGALKQYERLGDDPAGVHFLIAAARYLAAHSPTVRAQGQTYQIAHRLHRGEHLFEA